MPSIAITEGKAIGRDGQVVQAARGPAERRLGAGDRVDEPLRVVRVGHAEAKGCGEGVPGVALGLVRPNSVTASGRGP